MEALLFFFNIQYFYEKINKKDDLNAYFFLDLIIQPDV